MAKQSLAVKYRPKNFDDVVEQSAVITILKQQLMSGDIKHSYLFCGGAGTGKTTCARILANEINKGEGTPIEIDAASNNGVDDVRGIIQQARQQSLDSAYKVFIVDECQSISNSGWQAFLKVLEEPPMGAIFIFCTTDPQKIPKTILSRVQRYDFTRISQKGIYDRLLQIAKRNEENEPSEHSDAYLEAIEYIAKIADGGMRDAITMLDKCLSYVSLWNLTVTDVVNTLGTADFDTMFTLTDAVVEHSTKDMIEIIEGLYSQGKDLRVFMKNYTNFLLDLCKYEVTEDFNFLQIPSLYKERIKKNYYPVVYEMLTRFTKMNSEIRWETNPKALIEANLFAFCLGE